MANFIGEFLVRLGYVNDDSGAKQAEKSLEQVEEAAESLGDKLEKLKGSFIAIGAVWAGSKILSIVTDTADKFDELGRNAKAVGMTAEQLGSWQFAMEQAGADAEELQGSLETMADLVGQARLGEGEGLETFNKLGISVRDANGNLKGTDQLLTELTAKLGELDEATAIAYAGALGLQPQLMAGLRANSEELAKQRELYISTYAAAGVSINESAEQARAFKSALDMLTHTMDIITAAVGTRFFKIATQTFISLRAKITENISKITAILSGLMKVLMAVVKSFLAIGSTVLNVVSGVIDWWTRASTLFKGVVIGIGAITAAILVMNSAFMKSPLGRLITLAAIIGLLIDDFNVWKEGGDSLIGSLIGGFDEVSAKLESISPIFATILEHLDYVLMGLIGVPVALKGITTAFSVLSGVIGPVLGAFKALGPVISIVTTAVRVLGAAMLGTPIGWIIAAIAALVAAGIFLYNNWDAVTKALGEAWDWVAGKFTAGVEFIKGLFNSFVEFFLGIPAMISGAWSRLFDWFAEKLDFVGKGFDMLKGAASGVADFFGFGGDDEEEDEGDVEEKAAPPHEAAAPPRTSEQVPSTLVPAKQAPSTLAPAEQTPSTLVPAEQTPSTLVPAEQAPSTLVPTEQAPSTLVPTEQAPNTLMPAEQVPSALVPAEQAPSTTPPLAPLPAPTPLVIPSEIAPPEYTPPANTPFVPAAAPFNSEQLPAFEQAMQNMDANLTMPATLPPAATAPAAKTTNNITQNNGDTNISILAAPEPQRTAEAVAEQQATVQDNAVRNLRRQMS